VTVLHAIREVQIPLLVVLLIGGAGTKLLQTLRAGATEELIGPTALFPVHLRRPLAIGLCVVEGALGVGLAVTAGRFGEHDPANGVRLGTCLLFLVATCALVELRQSRPDAGCGCFGDFSTAPVSSRTLARSALLAVASLATVGIGRVALPKTAAGDVGMAAVLATELLLVALLSPEVGEGLIRLGYSEPCELRNLPTVRTLAALHRSKYWRRYSGLITSAVPADVWRELCWRYIVYPGSYSGRQTEVVFAVFLQRRRPAVFVAMVDSATGAPVERPAGKRGMLRLGLTALKRPAEPVPQSLSPAFKAVQATTAPADLPLSIDL
jgi:hypothetical protein